MQDTTELRLPDYISPSALKCFEKDMAEYFCRYLSPYKVQRVPQTQPMSVGSAFDAFAKSYIHYRLFGHYGKDDTYALEKIFEDQVDEHLWDWAWEAGKYVFEQYKNHGGLADMMLELNKASSEPQFEFSIKGTVETAVGDVTLLGKPDIFFINSEGARVIWDWKVNGFCGRSRTSPNKGYTKVRDAWTDEAKHSRNNQMPHKDCVLQDHCGIMINAAANMEDLNTMWADQLAIYGWLLGEAVGSENLIVGIDQIISNGIADHPPRLGNYPLLRIASFRNIVSSDYQFSLKDRIEYLWETITSDHLFRDLSKEDNDTKIKELIEETKALASDDPTARFINRVSRTGY